MADWVCVGLRRTPRRLLEGSRARTDCRPQKTPFPSFSVEPWAVAEVGSGHALHVSSQLSLLGNFLSEPRDQGSDGAGEGAHPGCPEAGDSRCPGG